MSTLFYEYEMAYRQERIRETMRRVRHSSRRRRLREAGGSAPSAFAVRVPAPRPPVDPARPVEDVPQELAGTTDSR